MYVRGNMCDLQCSSLCHNYFAYKIKITFKPMKLKKPGLANFKARHLPDLNQ